MDPALEFLQTVPWHRLPHHTHPRGYPGHAFLRGRHHRHPACLHEHLLHPFYELRDRRLRLSRFDGPRLPELGLVDLLAPPWVVRHEHFQRETAPTDLGVLHPGHAIPNHRDAEFAHLDHFGHFRACLLPGQAADVR